MTHRPRPALRSSGLRRWGARAVSALAVTGVGCALIAPAASGAPVVPTRQALVVLLHAHNALSAPRAGARRVESVAAVRPLTGVRTVLPVLDRAGSRGDGQWLRVRLPGRPNGHAGWISTYRTRLTSTEWRLRVELSSRQVTVYRHGRAKRHFRAVVGKPSTPTPRGQFFIEEALALSSYDAGGPFALASSARSRALHEFEGGPGQIALHGTDNLTGAPGTAVSHGCVRLSTRAITWIARRIGSGVPLTIVR
jgi:lipoprotein-anchoring transpeptidase ErfK/SrfK